jgi:DNA invertase Pin-like site-specific DNA recombinase
MARPNLRIQSKERLDRYVEEAGRAACYEEGFGVTGCDLKRRDLWAAYVRQSTREQAENDRMAEYLLSCARMAKERGLIVPREYVIYDSVTSEHLGRPGMKMLRTELVPQRHIAGIIIPTVGRLSCDDHHRQTFEKECGYYGVDFVYGDAPSGQDIWSMFARSGMSYANLVRVKTNRESALGGNIARVMTGKVPAGRVPYGYRYRCKEEIDSRGRRRISEAW